MTRRHDLSLVDDLVDNELPPKRAAEIKELIDSSPEWRERFEETTKLVEALRQKKTGSATEQYWVDLGNKILDRTSANAGYRDKFITKEEFRSGIGSVARSLISLAASITILLAAFFVGSQQVAQKQSPPANTPFFVAAPAINSIESDQRTDAENNRFDRHRHGTLLLGVPGMLGRYVALVELERMGR